jgi:hypothetical protein
MEGEVFTDWWQIALHQRELGDLAWVDDERMPKPLPDLGPHTRVWWEGDRICCEVDWDAWRTASGATP